MGVHVGDIGHVIAFPFEEAHHINFPAEQITASITGIGTIERYLIGPWGGIQGIAAPSVIRLIRINTSLK